MLQHDMLVSGLSWHPSANQLVSVGHDRNAFVWLLDEAAGTWVKPPQVVLLKSSKSALDVKWSPSGEMFAVATSSKQAMICRYDPASK